MQSIPLYRSKFMRKVHRQRWLKDLLHIHQWATQLLMIALQAMVFKEASSMICLSNFQKTWVTQCMVLTLSMWRPQKPLFLRTSCHRPWRSKSNKLQLINCPIHILVEQQYQLPWLAVLFYLLILWNLTLHQGKWHTILTNQLVVLLPLLCWPLPFKLQVQQLGPTLRQSPSTTSRLVSGLRPLQPTLLLQSEIQQTIQSPNWCLGMAHLQYLLTPWTIPHRVSQWRGTPQDLIPHWS